MWDFSFKICKYLRVFNDLESTFDNLGKVNEVQWSSVFFVFPWHMMPGKLCTLLMKKSPQAQRLFEFSVQRGLRLRLTRLRGTTKTTGETEETVVHGKVLDEMVSPSQETNLTFPWFIAMHPGCGRVYFVERSSNKSQWRDPRQQGPSPIVHLSPMDELSDLIGLVPPTVVWPDDQVQHTVPWGVSTRQKRMTQHWQVRPFH